MIECEICLEEYQEGDQERHWEMCVPRLVFRCTLCNGDYVSKEGLWNHLDLHEISDKNKESHYHEIKAKHKLYQCVLCNDQCAYSESSYRKHVHDVHNGFNLRCSDCGEKFQSEKLKNDHACSRCKVRDDTVSADFNILEKMPSSAEYLKQSWGEQSSNANEVLDDRLSIDDNGKKSDSPSVNLTESKDLPSRFECDICGQSFPAKGFLRRHKRAKFACMKGLQQTCPHCRRSFMREEYQEHFSLCEQKQFACEFCPMKFETSRPLSIHRRKVHRQEGGLKTMKDVTAKVLVSSVDSVSSSNAVPSGSSSTTCSQCGKECVAGYNLRQHILACHHPTKCDICGIIFEGNTKVYYHKTKEHKDEQYQCANCTRKFHSIKLYKNHSSACNPVHNKSSSFNNSTELIPKDKVDSIVTAKNPSSEASGNEIEGSSAIRLARQTTIHRKPEACNLCGATFSTASEAQHHMKTTHKAAKIKCPLCSMQLPSTLRLQIHVSHCGNEKIVCDFCGKALRHVIDLNFHRRKFCHAYKRSKEQEQMNVVESLRYGTDSSTMMLKKSPPLVDNDLPRTKCCCCKKCFPSMKHLLYHLKVAHKLIKCDICGISVLGLPALKYHKMKYHAKLKHECPTCGKQFRLKVGYNAHRFNCDGSVDSQTLNKESPVVLATTENNSSKMLVDPEKTSQPLVEDQTIKTIVSQEENTELKLEIEIEEPMLQEMKNKVSTEDPGRTFTTTLHPRAGESKDVKADAAENLENGNKIKEEYLEYEDEIVTELQTPTESTECHGVPSDRNASL